MTNITLHGSLPLAVEFTQEYKNTGKDYFKHLYQAKPTNFCRNLQALLIFHHTLISTEESIAFAHHMKGKPCTNHKQIRLLPQRRTSAQKQELALPLIWSLFL